MSQTALGGRNLQQLVPYVFGTILNNTRIGTWCVLVQQTVGVVNTTLTHNLGRVPQGFYATRNSSGGVLMDPSGGLGGWTTTAIVLRATVAGTFDVWIY